MKELMDFVWAVAQVNKEGFTIDLRTRKSVESGFAVAYEATQNSFGYESLERVIKHALANDGIVGGWLNPRTNQFYFDSTKVLEVRAEAIIEGKKQKQIAVFNLKTKEEISIEE